MPEGQQVAGAGEPWWYSVADLRIGGDGNDPVDDEVARDDVDHGVRQAGNSDNWPSRRQDDRICHLEALDPARMEYFSEDSTMAGRKIDAFMSWVGRDDTRRGPSRAM